MLVQRKDVRGRLWKVGIKDAWVGEVERAKRDVEVRRGCKGYKEMQFRTKVTMSEGPSLSI